LLDDSIKWLARPVSSRHDRSLLLTDPSLFEDPRFHQRERVVEQTMLRQSEIMFLRALSVLRRRVDESLQGLGAEFDVPFHSLPALGGAGRDLPQNEESER
jgi:hypothetical protein